MFCPTKDKIPVLQRANTIYRIRCPGCGEYYIGKTDRCLDTRFKEHGSRKDQPMSIHFLNCQPFHEYVSFFALPNVNDLPVEINLKEHFITAIFDNYSILDQCDSWNQLSFLEGFYIKMFSPLINKGLKASRELQLF